MTKTARSKSGTLIARVAPREGVLIATVAIACGVLVGNIYLSQTLIAPIARDLGIDRALAGIIVTLTQLGYALGLAFVVPLADSLENKRLALLGGGAAFLGLLAIATSATPAAFLIASVVGIGSSGAQVLLPMVSHFVAPERAGRTIGLVMSGLLAGIMLARPLSSSIAAALGWRATFYVVAAATLGVVVLLALALPKRVPQSHTPYGQILRSMAALVRDEPVLRLRALYQAALFGAFNIFWTAAPLALARSFGFDQRGIALFALAGAGGALAAPFAGRLADRGLATRATFAAFVAIALAFAATSVLVPAGALLGFAVAAIVLDAGVQTNQVVSQRVVYALSTHARGRVNAIYLTTIFLIGSTGPTLGSWLYERFGWSGVAATGCGIATLLCATHVVVVRMVDRGRSR